MTVVGVLHPVEMEEIAHSMAAHDLPTGFHGAAAQVFRRAAEES